MSSVQIQQLNQIAQKISDTAILALDNTVTSSDISELLKLLLQQDITVNACQIISNGEAYIYFQGELNNLWTVDRINIKVYFFDLVVAESQEVKRHLIILFELPSDFKIETFLSRYSNFSEQVTPFLNGAEYALLNNITFREGKILFSSIDGLAQYQTITLPSELNLFFPNNNFKVGFNFKVTIQLSGSFSKAFEALSLSTSLSLYAYIFSGERGLILRLADIFTPPLSRSVSSFHLQLSEIDVDLLLAALGQVYPNFFFTGTLGLGSTNIQVSILLDLIRESLTVRLKDININLPSISELANSIGLSSLEGNYLPNNSNGYGAISLDEFFFNVWLSPLYFKDLGFTLTTEHPVSLLPNIISLKPTLKLYVVSPFDTEARTEQIVLYGDWLLGNTNFHTLFSWKEKYLQAEMAVGQSLDITALLDKILPGVTLPGNIALMDMELSADLAERSFEAEIDVATDWEFQVAGANFAIYELFMEMAYADNKVTDCEIKGRMMLAGLELETLAIYDSTSGWIVRGNTIPGETINFTNIFNRLKNDLNGIAGNIADIPDAYVDIAITDLFMEYQPDAQRFTAYTSLAHSVQITSGFTIDTIFVQMNVESDSLTGQCRIMLTIADVNIFLQCQKLPADAGWQFQGSTENNKQIPIGKLINDLANKFGSLSLPATISDLTLENISVSYNTKSSNFHFSCEALFPVDSKNLDLTLNIDCEQENNSYKKSFSGKLKVSDLEFALDFTQDPTTNILLATYSHSGSSKRIKIKELITNISTDISSYIPDSLYIDLKDVLLAFYKDSSGTKFLFGFDIWTLDKK